MNHKSFLAFTLAELLIALAILGVIATFTIPKLIIIQQDQKSNALAKEAMAAITSAFLAHQSMGLVSSATKAPDLTPYFNYVSVDTSSSVDTRPSGSAKTCSATNPCLRMHNGSLIYFVSNTFNGTATTNVISVYLDADGVYTGNSDGLAIMLYYTGRLTTRANVVSGSADSSGTYNPGAYDPSWFSL